ncbi:hypothetical protein GCM10027296_42040 [Chitinimonas naiadis]
MRASAITISGMTMVPFKAAANAALRPTTRFTADIGSSLQEVAAAARPDSHYRAVIAAPAGSDSAAEQVLSGQDLS